MTIAVKPQTAHLVRAAVVHLDMTILFYQISCYLHLYGTFLLKLLKQFQLHNTWVNWMRRNTLHFEVEIKDGNCQWLSSTEQNKVQWVFSFPYPDFPRNFTEKTIKEGALVSGSRCSGERVH